MTTPQASFEEVVDAAATRAGLGSESKAPDPEPTCEPYARIDRNRLIRLAHALPDSISAVLLCVEWHAARQARLQRGDYARQYVARVSAKALATETGFTERTIRTALKRLKRTGAIEVVSVPAGKTAVYKPILRTMRGARSTLKSTVSDTAMGRDNSKPFIPGAIQLEGN